MTGLPAMRSPVYPEDKWHNLAALAWDVWPRRGWKQALVRRLLPDVATVLDAQRDAETEHLVYLTRRARKDTR